MSEQVRVGVAVFVRRLEDQKFLMIKRQGSHGANTWALPGGSVHLWETTEAAARREVLEEVNLERLIDLRLLAVTDDMFPSAGKHFVTLWMTAFLPAGAEPQIMEPDKCSELGWFDFATLPDPLFQPCWANLFDQLGSTPF